MLLWGGAFGFTTAAVVLLGWSARARFRRSDPAGRLAVTADGSLEFRAESLPSGSALLQWWLVVEARHSPDRVWTDRTPLTAVSRSPGPGLRGAYQVEARWELTDWFGFLRWSPAAPRWTAELTRIGDSRPWLPTHRPRSHQGPWRTRRPGHRAGDPFDVRRYSPGDDLRRLHWPLYAHAGELFVRTADPSPPPEGRWRLVLDLWAGSEADLDHRLARLTGWLEHLDATGGSWSLDIPGRGTWGPGSDFRRILAGLSPQNGGLPDRALSPGLWLVTGEGTPAARSDLPVLVIPGPEEPPRTRGPWWARP